MLDRYVRLVVLLLVAGVASLGFAAETKAKRPAPTEEVRKEAAPRVAAIYRDDIDKAKTPPQKAELAQRMIADAVATANDWDGRYVLLVAARDLALRAADLTTALSAVDELHQDFEGDIITAKVDLLATALKSARQPAQAKPIVTEALKLLDEAIAADHFVAAKLLLPTAVAAARAARDVPQTKAFADREGDLDRCAAWFQESQAARTTLQIKPADPQANHAVGRYLCLVKDQWDTGLPMLLLGSEAAFKKAAKADLLVPTTGDGQMAVGDLWWELAEAEQGAVKDQLQLRAVVWYRIASETLEGLAKTKIDKRLKSVRAAAPKETDVAASDTPAAATTPTPPRTGSRKREVKGLLYLMADDEGEVRINGKEFATIKEKPSAHEVTFKLGDLITVSAKHISYERGFACFFKSDDGKVVFFSDITSWRMYHPAVATKWWEVKPGSEHPAPEHGHKNYMKLPEAAGYGYDALWAKLTEQSVFLYHVVNADDLSDAAPKAGPRKPQMGAVEGTLYVMTNDFGDIMLNGVPLLESRVKETSHSVSLRPSDVIAVKMSNVQYDRGFMLAFVAKEGKGRIFTNFVDWRCYVPPKPQRWWDFKPSPNDLPPVQSKKGTDFSFSITDLPVEHVWGHNNNISFMYHVVTAQELRAGK